MVTSCQENKDKEVFPFMNASLTSIPVQEAKKTRWVSLKQKYHNFRAKSEKIPFNQLSLKIKQYKIIWGNNMLKLYSLLLPQLVHDTPNQIVCFPIPKTWNLRDPRQEKVKTRTVENGTKQVIYMCCQKVPIPNSL